MRVNLVSFLDPRVYQGGGEMVSRQLLDVGLMLGHDIRVSSARPSALSLHERPHISLLVDIFNSGHSLKSFGAWRGFGRDFLHRIINSAPFVHLTTAYADVCNLPYLPCSGLKGCCCPVKPSLGLTQRIIMRDWSNDCFADSAAVRILYEDAALNVYLSPMHRDVTETLLGSTALPPSYILNPLIDTHQFRNLKQKRDIEYLFVGVVSEAKGFESMRARFKNQDIHFVGRCAPGTKLDFGTYHGHVPYEQVSQYMNRAANFVFLPRWPEPQGRVVAEAALCGCNIIGNENVGALSLEMDLADPRNYLNVEEDFWKSIEELL
jgi:glycosyltransferase involved in cell wall biosynthesis